MAFKKNKEVFSLSWKILKNAVTTLLRWPHDMFIVSFESINYKHAFWNA